MLLHIRRYFIGQTSLVKDVGALGSNGFQSFGKERSLDHITFLEHLTRFGVDEIPITGWILVEWYFS